MIKCLWERVTALNHDIALMGLKVMNMRSEKDENERINETAVAEDIKDTEDTMTEDDKEALIAIIASVAAIIATICLWVLNDAGLLWRPEPTPTPKIICTSDIVYITDTGEYYHNEECRYLKYSRHEMTREEAEEEGYKPCGVCQP